MEHCVEALCDTMVWMVAIWAVVKIAKCVIETGAATYVNLAKMSAKAAGTKKKK